MCPVAVVLFHKAALLSAHAVDKSKATSRPRRQGRRVLAFTGAKRKSLTEEVGGLGAGFGRKGTQASALPKIARST
jgi:hypothetical protein